MSNNRIIQTNTDSPLFCNIHSQNRSIYHDARSRLEKLQDRCTALATEGPGSSTAAKTLVFVPLRQRGCAGYSYTLIERIKNSDLSSLTGFLTLTVPPQHYCCAHYAWSQIWRRWNSFRTYMKRLKIFSKYFAVVEPTKRFWPHIHCLLDARFISKPEFKKLCSAWDGRVNYSYRSIRTGAGYLIKYLGKDFRAAHHSASKRNSFHAYLRAFKLRQWSCSRGLIGPYKSRSKKDYEYAGTYPASVKVIKKHNNLVYQNSDVSPGDTISSYGNTRRHLVIDHETWVENDYEDNLYDCPVAEQHVTETTNSNAD